MTAQGFKQFNRENITMEIGRVFGSDVTLELGAVTESINVTAVSTQLETQTASREPLASRAGERFGEAGAEAPSPTNHSEGGLPGPRPAPAPAASLDAWATC